MTGVDGSFKGLMGERVGEERRDVEVREEGRAARPKHLWWSWRCRRLPAFCNLQDTG